MPKLPNPVTDRLPWTSRARPCSEFLLPSVGLPFSRRCPCQLSPYPRGARQTLHPFRHLLRRRIAAAEQISKAAPTRHAGQDSVHEQRHVSGHALTRVSRRNSESSKDSRHQSPVQQSLVMPVSCSLRPTLRRWWPSAALVQLALWQQGVSLLVLVPRHSIPHWMCRLSER